MTMSRKKTRDTDDATNVARRAMMRPQSDNLGRAEPRLAPPKYAERQHARPGAGIKRSRAAMQKKSR
jgi:hypothetical protein